ncbi:spindolin-related protein [Photobacterium aphoticum]|uniref:Spindolin-related protein n=1 Tax=Photobacterium aphoticum TaxID=754436 RepID=A0A090R1M0_9GAMM|nr:spindolin-related protein [Photobacterium aphoticum]
MKFSQPKATALAVASLCALGYSSVASSHGYMEYPPARQEICAQDGGYWGAQDGSQIPNAACRAAFLESGWFPFVQKPEFAKLVSNYRDQAAVEKAVPDGSLCAASDKKKIGMDVASADWQKTAITLDPNGQLKVLYRAETPHNPSFWEFYLTKPGLIMPLKY